MSLVDVPRVCGVAVLFESEIEEAPVSFLKIFRERFWVKKGDIYINFRSLEKRANRCCDDILREEYLAQIVAETTMIKSFAEQLGVSLTEYLFIKDHYDRLNTLTEMRLRRFSGNAILLIRMNLSK